MTLLNGKKSDGTLSQESIDEMNSRFTLEISYPSYPIKKSLLYSSNDDIKYRVIICRHFNIVKKCDLLTLICKCHKDRRGNLNFRAFFFVYIFVFFSVNEYNGVALSLFRGHFSPSINEDEMISTLRLMDDEEAHFWPSLADIIECKKKEISADLIFRRKLIHKQALSFNPSVSLVAHLREQTRGNSDKAGVSNKEM